MRRLLPLGLLVLMGCSTPKPREIYHTKPLTIILDTEEGINKSYQLFTLGKRPDEKVRGFRVNEQIYCTRGDHTTLGHELMHVIKGNYHPRRELKHWRRE